MLIIILQRAPSHISCLLSGRGPGQLQSRSSRRVETFTRPIASKESETSSGTKHHYLSMGHKIQVMNYDPSSDTIEIVLYNRKSAQNDRENIHTYKFFLFSKVTQKYTASFQTFKKYSEPYNWNRVDNLICGEADRTMDVGMRFRRVMFGLIPETFKSRNEEKEEEYVSKFLKLLSYLEKLRDSDDSKSKLDVKIVTSKTRKDTKNQDFAKARQDMTDTMIRFPVQLRRGKKDAFEWIEVAISSTFDTSMSYRIIFNWLVASSTKVEHQIQLLQRKFKNFGLNFISFPQTTVSWDLFIHAVSHMSIGLDIILLLSLIRPGSDAYQTFLCTPAFIRITCTHSLHAPACGTNFYHGPGPCSSEHDRRNPIET